jgi:hypothetical protein
MTDEEKRPDAGGTARGAEARRLEDPPHTTARGGRKRRSQRVIEAERKHMCQQLPYGLWVERDGSGVLFNRYYTPIWRRTCDGITSRVTDPPRWPDGRIWINWTRQVHFYDFRFTPWHHAEARELCEEVLAWFDVGDVR